MLCAHTVRNLKPGTFDQFAAAFMPADVDPPAGWIRFDMLRSLSDENQVITFGFFDGTRAELEGNQDDHGYSERVATIEPFVDSVVLNGVYEVVMDMAVA